jgi:hypothetical protein
MITRDFKSQKLPPKNNFLNPQQKKELRKMLIEKFTKLFGLANPSAVVEEVDRFFNANGPINSQTLAELEEQIKREAIKYKSNGAQSQKKSQMPKTEIQKSVNENQCPNFAEETENGNNCALNAKAKNCLAPKAGEEDEEGDWDTLGAYQAYILRQEKELEKKKRALEQKAIRIQLNKQIKEKDHKEKLEKEEHESYVNVETLQLEHHKYQTELNEKRKAEEKKQLFNLQHKMIKERDLQLAKEKEVNDTMERKIKECIENDLVRQKQLQIAQNEIRRAEMVKVREENDLRKQKKKEMDERDRKEEIELQKLSDKLAEELENQRNAELKAKADKIQQMIVMGEKVVKNQKEKNIEEERKINEYIEKKERAMNRKEKRTQLTEKENKEHYKKFLEYQMQDKKERNVNEKNFYREQADIWKQEEEFYAKIKQEQNLKINAENKQYKDILEKQVQEKQARITKKANIEMPDEELMKQKLFEQIQSLDLQHQLLNEQLSEN